MATVAAQKRAAEKAQARAEYIKNAEIIFSGNIALVHSQYEPKHYTVRIAGMKATSCDCDDCYYRKRTCKHQEAVQLRLDATLPNLDTAEADELIEAMSDIFKPALPEGYRVRLVKGVLKVVPVKSAKAVQKSAKSAPQKTIKPCPALNKQIRFVNKVA